jgi:hypothetical protein
MRPLMSLWLKRPRGSTMINQMLQLIQVLNHRLISMGDGFHSLMLQMLKMPQMLWWMTMTPSRHQDLLTYKLHHHLLCWMNHGITSYWYRSPGPGFMSLW